MSRRARSPVLAEFLCLRVPPEMKDQLAEAVLAFGKSRSEVARIILATGLRTLAARSERDGQ